MSDTEDKATEETEVAKLQCTKYKDVEKSVIIVDDSVNKLNAVL